MTTLPEALRLADLLEMGSIWQDQEKAAAELRRLHAENEALRADLTENEALRERLADILRRTAVALRGPEPPLTRWSWHDLPERAAAAIAAIGVMQRAAAAGALEALNVYASKAEHRRTHADDCAAEDAITALRAALAEQPQPLTIERLRGALVASRIIDPGAVEDPDNYDDGVTLARIEALYRRIT